MKCSILIPLLMFTFALVCGCSRHSGEAAPPAAPEKASESRVQHGTNGEVIVKLDAATQQLLGLQTAAVAPAELGPEIQAIGRVLDVTGLASNAADLATAQANSQASQEELKRLRTLAEQNNASQRALQAAEAAASRDQVQMEAARLRLIANWGNILAAQTDLPGLVRSLVSLSNCLVQLNLPAGEFLKQPPEGAQIRPLNTNIAPVEARFLGPAPAIDPQFQAAAYLFLVSPNVAGLQPGTALQGFLKVPGNPLKGVVAPREAIVHYNGAAWVYRQKSAEEFERTEVALDRLLAEGWFIKQGLKPEEKVVTTGVQAMLSEELKGQGGE